MVRETAAAAIGVSKYTAPHVQARSREALPRKKEHAVSWPRRGRRGLRLHHGVFSHGGIGSNGGQGRRRTRLITLSSPGFEALARFVGKYETGGGEKMRNSHKAGPSTFCGSRSREELLSAGAFKGQVAAISGIRVRKAGTPRSIVAR